MAFKAEELASKVFPDVFLEAGTGLWAACPQDTMDKGGKCPDNTKKPGPPGPHGPGGPGCGAGSSPGPRPHRAGGLDRDALVLLQAQLRDRRVRDQAAAL